MNDHNSELLHRNLPCNIEAEKALLGSLLIKNDNISLVALIIGEECFFYSLHQRLYRNILKMWERGVVATPLILKDILGNDEDIGLLEMSAFDYLIDLTNFANMVLNVESLAKNIRDNFFLRQLINVGTEIVNDAYDVNLENTVEKQLEVAEHKIYSLAVRDEKVNVIEVSSSVDLVVKQVKKAIDTSTAIRGLSTGFRDIDYLLGGLHNSDLIIIAGRPSMGKTALAINMMINIAKNFDDRKKSVGFFSLEMSSEQLVTRMLSIESEINASKIKSGMLSVRNGELAKLMDASKNIRELNLFIDDTPAITINELRARSRRLKRKKNLSCIFVDYLQLLKGHGKNNDNRVQEVSEITQGLKAVAKELNVPVVALSQLSRAVEQRDDKRPQLADLRESGTIEQDADVVMFIYREQYYELRKQPKEGTAKHQEWQEKMESVMNQADIIIAKHRNGPIGIRSLFFNSNTTIFKDYDNISLDKIDEIS